MRIIAVVLAAGCPAPDSTYTPDCASTSTTIAESCGGGIEVAGPFVEVTTVDGGWSSAAALRPDGAWEWVYSGISDPLDPGLVAGPWSHIDGGDDTLCGIGRDDGEVVCFEVGGRSVGLFDLQPLGVGAFADVQLGRDTVCGLAASDGAVRCAGSGRLAEIAPWTGVFAALSHRGDDWLGLGEDGELAGWTPDGAGASAELPDGPFVAIGGGSAAGCAVRDDGALACCGELANGAPTGVFAEVVTADDAFACALRADGAGTCWGPAATLCDPPEVGPFRQLALGGVRCGVVPDGSVACLPEYYPAYTESMGCYE